MTTDWQAADEMSGGEVTANRLAVDTVFDGGSVEVLSCADAGAIRLAFRPDNAADFAQWFYFRLSGAAHQHCRIDLEGAAACAFPDGWRDYRAVASYDRVHWFRVDTAYDGATLHICHTPLHDTVYYAYFEPYTETRHAELIGALQQLPEVSVTRLTSTALGRAVDCLTVGTAGPGKRQVWLIARQHPGETMAEWFIEGLLDRLCRRGSFAGDPLADALLAGAVFHVVPNMNPDGAALGNLRTNAKGANLNREWVAPDATRSPEVLAVRAAIEAAGCDMFFDIHGDEALPYVFVAGCEMLPNFGEREAAQQAAFIRYFKEASPDFQDRHGYHADRYREDALKLASKYIGYTYRCLSLTLEMPFKDNANRPDPAVGWNGARSATLGAAMLTAIGRYLGEFG